jgi:hypothetical protein
VATAVLTACSAAGVHVLDESESANVLPPDLGPIVVEASGIDAAPPPPTFPPPPPAPPPAADAPIKAAPERFSGGTQRCPALPPLGVRPAATGSGTWAVVVGVNDYPGTEHDLRSAVPDAEEMNRALDVLAVPRANRLVLTDGQATAGAIAGAADWLVDRAGPDAVAVFFFAGHVRKQAAATEAMVGADGCTLDDAQLARRLAPLRARRAWVAMAACYGGGFTEVLRPGVVLTGAAGAGERAYENSSFNRSYMVEYMVRQAIVEGRASDSVQAAYGYARYALSLDRFSNRLPVQVDRSDGHLDLRPPGAPRPPPASPARPSDRKQDQPSGGGGSSTKPAPAPTSTTTTTRCTLGVCLR